MTSTKKIRLASSLIGTALSLLPLTLRAEQPNIVFIMADDHATNAVSAYGGRLGDVFKTPNIDRIAQQGVMLQGMFAANALCTPSRASILTGQHSNLNGVRTLKQPLERDQDNLAKQLQQVGYQTAVVGKWHLNREPAGFDYYSVLPNQGKYHNPKFKQTGATWQDGQKGGVQQTGYITDLITDQSLQWIDKRDTDKPFFLMIHHKAPHAPWQPAERHKNLFADIKVPEPDSLYKRETHGPTDAVIIDGKKGQQFGSSVSRRIEGRSLVERFKSRLAAPPTTAASYDKHNVTSAAYQKYLKNYLRTLVAVDENVGRVLDYLDDNNLTDNTIIIYTSDQGMMLGEHDYYDKRWIYEESIRMPFLVRYPNKIPAGKTIEELYQNIDIAPTLLDFAQAKPLDKVQGESFSSSLTKPSQAKGREAIYYRYWLHMAHHFVPAHYGVRTKDHKLAFFYGLPLDVEGAMPAATPPYWELYNIAKDPKEMRNIYGTADTSKVTKELKGKLLTLKQQFQDRDERYPELMKLRKQHWNK